MEVNVSDFPSSLFESVRDALAHYTVGFVRLDKARQGLDAILVGSGTLVTAGSTHAILTANHVMEELPKRQKLGLIVSRTPTHITVDASELQFVTVGKGRDAREGPDLGVIILSPNISSSLAARKSFINLEKYRDRLLCSPPQLEEGIWAVNGFVAELTREEGPEGGFDRVKGFYLLSGIGCAEKAPGAGEYDYFRLPLTYCPELGLPKSFGGTSGAGLWQVLLRRTPDGEFRHEEMLLSGVAFFQDPIDESRSALRLHGRKSVYDAAYRAIRPDRA